MIILQHAARLAFRSKSFFAAMACAAALVPAAASAADEPFFKWVETYKQEAAAKGISKELLDRAFRDLAPNERVVELDRRQPEGTMTFEQYKERIVSQQRVNEGRRKLAQHRDLLNRISAEYGVQPRFIVALWGIETNYGSNTGGFDVIEALATLAYDGRRGEFFRKELTNAFTIINDGHIKLEDMRGSWAGAMGQSQFMPSSFVAYAADGNGDGKKDIWHTQEDVFASIANYLAKSGWKDDQTWGRRVTLPAGFDNSLADIKKSRSLQEWSRLGVRDADGNALPDVDIDASVVFPGEAGGEAYLAYNNFKTVMKWNRSLYFATSVGILSDRLAGY